MILIIWIYARHWPPYDSRVAAYSAFASAACLLFADREAQLSENWIAFNEHCEQSQRFDKQIKS